MKDSRQNGKSKRQVENFCFIHYTIQTWHSVFVSLHPSRKILLVESELKTINMLQESCPEVMVPHKKIIKDLSVMAFTE